MRAEDVDETMLDRAMDAYWDGDGGTREGLRAALAAVIPLVQQAERDRAAAMVEFPPMAIQQMAIFPFFRHWLGDCAKAILARNTP